MAEPDFDIDAAAEKFDARRVIDKPAPPDEGGDDDGDGDAGAPPGFLSYAEYVAKGGDPDMYRGRKAYESEHERINENKRLRKDVKGLQTTVQQTMEAVNTWQSRETEKIRAEVEADLAQAMADEDPKAAIDAQKKLDAINATPKPAPERQPENPIIQAFRVANPVLDEDSEEFDDEFNADVEAFFNVTAQQLGQNGRRQLTDGQISRILKKAMKDANELHGIESAADVEPGESPRNSRRAGNVVPKRRAARQPVAPKAEDFVIDNPRNARQKNAAPEVRDMIRDKAEQQALKSGKSQEDAKKAGDEAAKRFETSLAR